MITLAVITLLVFAYVALCVMLHLSIARRSLPVRYTSLPRISTEQAAHDSLPCILSAITYMGRAGQGIDTPVGAALDAIRAMLTGMAHVPTAELPPVAPPLPTVGTVKTPPAPLTLDNVIVSTVKATGTNDIEESDNSLAELLRKHGPLSARTLKDKHKATEEQFLRMLGAARIVETGKGKTRAYKLSPITPVPAPLADANMPGDIAPHDAHVSSFAAQPAKKTRGRKTKTTPPAPVADEIPAGFGEVITPAPAPVASPVPVTPIAPPAPVSVDPIKVRAQEVGVMTQSLTTSELLAELLTRIGKDVPAQNRARAKDAIKELSRVFGTA